MTSIDSVSKSLESSVVVRSLLPGICGVISYRYSAGSRLACGTKEFVDVETLASAVILGAVAYMLHRSLVYPPIELFMNSACAKNFREHCPMISKNTVLSLYCLWTEQLPGSAELKHPTPEAISAVSERSTRWADYAHSQYVAAWSILSGSVIAAGEYGVCKGFSIRVLLAVFTFVFAAMVSDWRLRALRERFLIVVNEDSKDENSALEAVSKPS